MGDLFEKIHLNELAEMLTKHFGSKVGGWIVRAILLAVVLALFAIVVGVIVGVSTRVHADWNNWKPETPVVNNLDAQPRDETIKPTSKPQSQQSPAAAVIRPSTEKTLHNHKSTGTSRATQPATLTPVAPSLPRYAPCELGEGSQMQRNWTENGPPPCPKGKNSNASDNYTIYSDATPLDFDIIDATIGQRNNEIVSHNTFVMRGFHQQRDNSYYAESYKVSEVIKGLTLRFEIEQIAKGARADPTIPFPAEKIL